jgi:hypothetical protein
MNTQEKFIGRLQEMAEDFKVQLVVDQRYTNTGRISFAYPDQMEPIVSFIFQFNVSTGSFPDLHDVIGKNEKGGLWTACGGARLDLVIDKLAEALAEAFAANTGVKAS